MQEEIQYLLYLKGYRLKVLINSSENIKILKKKFYLLSYKLPQVLSMVEACMIDGRM